MVPCSERAGYGLWTTSACTTFGGRKMNGQMSVLLLGCFMLMSTMQLFLSASMRPKRWDPKQKDTKRVELIHTDSVPNKTKNTITHPYIVSSALTYIPSTPKTPPDSSPWPWEYNHTHAVNQVHLSSYRGMLLENWKPVNPRESDLERRHVRC